MKREPGHPRAAAVHRPLGARRPCIQASDRLTPLRHPTRRLEASPLHPSLLAARLRCLHHSLTRHARHAPAQQRRCASSRASDHGARSRCVPSYAAPVLRPPRGPPAPGTWRYDESFLSQTFAVSTEGPERHLSADAGKQFLPWMSERPSPSPCTPPSPPRPDRPTHQLTERSRVRAHPPCSPRPGMTVYHYFSCITRTPDQCGGGGDWSHSAHSRMCSFAEMSSGCISRYIWYSWLARSNCRCW